MPQRGLDILSVLDEVQRPAAPTAKPSILDVLSEVQAKPVAAPRQATPPPFNAPRLVTAPPASRDPLTALGKATIISPALPRSPLTIAESAVRAPIAGLARVFTKPAWGALEAAADTLGLESVAAWSRAASQQADEIVTTIRGPQTGAGPTEQAVYSGLESVGVTAPALVAGAATGSPAVALGIMGAATGGEAYSEAKDAGASPLKAMGYAAVQGVTEVLTEKIPASRLLGDLAKRTDLVQTLLRQAAVEVPGEQVATFVQDLSNWTALHPEKPLSEFPDAAKNAAYQTLVSTLVGTIVQTGSGVAVARLAQPSTGQGEPAAPVASQPTVPRRGIVAEAVEAAKQKVPWPTEPPIGADVTDLMSSPAAVVPPAAVGASASPPVAPAVPIATAGDLTQDQRNGIARAEAEAAPPARLDPEAIASGRALERRVTVGESPTGEERRAETAEARGTLSVDEASTEDAEILEALTERLPDVSNKELAGILADNREKQRTAPQVSKEPGYLDLFDRVEDAVVQEMNRRGLPTPKEAPRPVRTIDVKPTSVVEVSPPKADRDEHTFSSTQVNLPEAHAAAVVQMAKAIPDADIEANGRAGDSEGSAPHVTVKYGIHSTDVEDVRKVLADEPPITVTLGTTSFFPNGESGSGDVLKIDVDSPDLHRLNAKIAEALEVTDTHPTYTPHVTIAYLQAGKGKEYEGDDSLKGRTMTLDTLTFSTKDGKIYEIPLTGTQTAAEAAPSQKAAWEVREDEIAASVKASKDSGATHLDTMPMGVESLRGHRFVSLRDGKDWIARTVDNRGVVYLVSPDGKSEEQISGTERGEFIHKGSSPKDYAVAVKANRIQRDVAAGKPAKQPATPASGIARLSIRAHTYRDKPGFLIAGVDAQGRHPSVFTETRASAERIKARLIAGEDITQEDFNPGKAPAAETAPVRPGRGGRGGVSSLPLSKGPSAPLPRPQTSNTPVPVTPRLRQSAILDNLRKGLGGLPVRVGRFRQRAHGIFKEEPRAIRLRVANDLQTFFHEAGHDIDITLLRIDRTNKAWRKELIALGQRTSRPSYTQTQQRKEGAAEFLRLYITEPSEAQAQAPRYFAEFERALDTQPDLRDVLHQTREDVQGLISQSPATRGRLRIDREGDRGLVRQAVAAPRETATTAIRALTTTLIDDLAPLKQAVDAMRDGTPLHYKANAYTLARVARGAAGKAEAFLEQGVRGRAGRFVGPSLSDALTPVEGHLEAFGDYLIALRAVELHGRDINPGLALDEADGIIDETRARPDIAAFDQAKEAVYAYQNGVLEYARQYGAFSADQLKQIRALNHAYVPMQRVFDDAEEALRSGGAKRIANRAVPIKRIKGSGRDIVDPIESIVGNTFTLVDMVEKNRAMQALTRQAEAAAGSARWIERIPDPQVATQFNLSQVSRQIGVALDDAGVDTPDNLDEALDARVTVFTPATFAKGTEHIVTVIRNGKRQFWQVNDPALYEAISVIGPRDTSRLLQWLSAPTRLLRTTATLTPGFIARNPGRDTIVAFLQSRYGFVPVIDTVRGLIAQVRGDEDARLFFTSGIAQATLAAQDRTSRQALVKQISTQVGFFRFVAGSPIEALRALSSQLEVATRLGEFKLALDAGGVERGLMGRLFDIGGTRPALTEETLIRATMAGRDVTTDFSKGGSFTREANRFYAFFNARVQGYARMAEAVKHDPIGVGLKLSALALFSAALWFLHDDDDTWDEKQAWEKHTYWHLQLPGVGWAIKIPKPFEWGYVPDLVEAALDYMKKGDPERFAKMRDSLVGSRPEEVVVNLLPTAILPLVEWWANYDSFRDTHIVRPWDVGLDTELQYSDFTSETAKLLGQIMPVAPAHIDHLIAGYTAGFGRGVVQGVDVGLGAVGAAPTKNLPTRAMAQTPVAGTFLSDRTFGSTSQSIQDIYDAAEAIAKAEASVKAYVTRGGDLSRARERVTEATTDPLWRRRTAVLAARKDFQEIGQHIKAIYAAPPQAMTPAQKRDRLNRFYERMVVVSRTALGKPVSESRLRNVVEGGRIQSRIGVE